MRPGLQNIYRCCLVALIVLLPSAGRADILNLGTFGRTYPIAEKDAVKEIEERAQNVDWAKLFAESKTEALKNYRPDNILQLPRAVKNRTFQVDMTYMLADDIHDAEGRVLYPKGYTFNPLDYIDYPNTIIVIDAQDKQQLQWLKTAGHVDDLSARILITGGSYYDVSVMLKRPVFYALPIILERLRIQALPSVVFQKENMMEVHEIHVFPKKD